MAYIHIYKGSPTGGGLNGTMVSEGSGTSPIDSGLLNANINEESAPIKLSIRCDAGYQTSGNTVITPIGLTASKWALASDNNGVPGAWLAYGSTLTIASAIGSTNVIFWAKAKATSDENPVRDTVVDLQVTATIIAS